MTTSRPTRTRLGDALLRDRHGVGRLGEDRRADLAAEHPELFDRGRALEVGTDEERVAALLAEPAGELGRGGRLS